MAVVHSRCPHGLPHRARLSASRRLRRRASYRIGTAACGRPHMGIRDRERDAQRRHRTALRGLRPRRRRRPRGDKAAGGDPPYSGGALVLGYLDAGTLEPYRPWFRRAKPYRLDYWKQWGEWYANVNAPGFRKLIVGVATSFERKGLDGLFLDNTDMIETHPKQAPGMRRLVCGAREARPRPPRFSLRPERRRRRQADHPLPRRLEPRRHRHRPKRGARPARDARARPPDARDRLRQACELARRRPRHPARVPDGRAAVRLESRADADPAAAAALLSRFT